MNLKWRLAWSWNGICIHVEWYWHEMEMTIGMILTCGCNDDCNGIEMRLTRRLARCWPDSWHGIEITVDLILKCDWNDYWNSSGMPFTWRLPRCWNANGMTIGVLLKLELNLLLEWYWMAIEMDDWSGRLKWTIETAIEMWLVWSWYGEWTDIEMLLSLSWSECWNGLERDWNGDCNAVELILKLIL